MHKASIRSSKVYSAIFKIRMPIEFFFNKKGAFDGIGIDVGKATKEEIQIAEQLCRKLENVLVKNATGKATIKGIPSK